MKTILFVCVHNAGRSQMAEAFFNALAAEVGLEARAESAGTIAGREINPIARRVMQELDISMEGHRPKMLTQEMADKAHKIITMGCGVDADACPARIHLTEDWGLDDPANASLEEVRRIRDEIQKKVHHLIEGMKRED